MKKILWFSLFIVLIGISFVSAECSDSDGGKDYYVKGILISELEGFLGEEDYCIDEEGFKYVSEGSRVGEWYCQDINDGATTSYDCPNGCKDGACVEEVATCTDSDGGKDYYVKGILISELEGFLGEEDYCIDEEGFKYVSEGSRVGEWYCQDINDGATTFYDCPNGCKDGACVGETCDEKGGIICKSNQVCTGSEIPTRDTGSCCLASCYESEEEPLEATCIDSDDGRNHYEKGTLSVRGYGEKYEDKCAFGDKEGTTAVEGCSGSSSCYLWEFYCSYLGADYASSETINCPNGCLNGACIQLTTNETATCVDSDDGKEPFVKGNVNYNIDGKNYVAEDWCSTNQGNGGYVESCSGDNCNLIEIICSETTGGSDYTLITCGDGCKNGACIVVTPTEETGPIEISNEIKGEPNTCNGCELDGKCYPLGYRKGGEYCFDNYEFMRQLEAEESCDNNFECKSNVCVSDECVSEGLLKRILNWFRRLFGGE